MYKQYYKNNLALIISDFFLTSLIFVITAWLRPYLPGEGLAGADVVPHDSMYYLAPFSLSVIFTIAGVYNFRSVPRLHDQLRTLISAYALWGWLIVGALYFSFRETSRLFVVYFAVANLGALIVARYLIWNFLNRVEDGASAARVLIFGSVQSSSRLCEMVLKGLPAGFKLIGMSDFKEPQQNCSDVPFLGTAQSLQDIVKTNYIDIVIISLDQTSLEEANPLVMDLLRIPVRVLLTQDYSRLPFLDLEIERIGNIILVGLLEPVITGWNRLFKRMFDIVFASISMLILWPLFLIISLGIRFESSGPIIFRTKRVGNAGKLFTMYKFRTMYHGAPEFLDTLPVVNHGSQGIYKIQDDPRITPFGRFLRRWSLDELPQLFNVLKGEMSVVGPRPEQPFITEQYETWQWQRTQVPPGITGWWQVHGRSEHPMHLNTHLDTYYVANYSMMLDIKILFLTIFEVIKGRGAY